MIEYIYIYIIALDSPESMKGAFHVGAKGLVQCIGTLSFLFKGYSFSYFIGRMH